MSIHDAIEVVRGNADLADFVGPRDEGLVSAAEEALGWTFPPSYRTFVSELGAGSFGGEEFYGVISDDLEHSGVPDAVWVTLDARREWGLPESMVVVYFDGGVQYFVLDTAEGGPSGEPPVRAVTPGLSDFGEELPVVARDFGSLFAELVADEADESE